MMAWSASALRYRAADERELAMLVYEPGDGIQPDAGIILFHGGALRAGSADELAPHCQRLAARGILAASADYRLLGRGADSIKDCVADVRTAVRSFVARAFAQGLKPSQLASGGSSAGAHLALVAAMTAGDAPADDRALSAVVALNPAGSDLGSFDSAAQRQLERQVGLPDGTLTQYSLIDLVHPRIPPVLIHHGTRDEVEPIDCVRRFRDAMLRSGNECTLLEYQDAVHGFHYPSAGGRFDAVVDATARFLLEKVAERRPSTTSRSLNASHRAS